MDFSNIAYYIKSGAKDAKHNSAMSLSSVIVVIAGLCVFGVYTLLSMNISYITTQLCSRYSITAYIEKGTPEDRGEEIRGEISDIDGVKSVEYVTESEALEQCREMFGDNAGFLDGLEEDNPLRGSMIITINDIAESEAIAKKTEQVTDVVWVRDDSELADKLISSTAFVRHISVILLIIFFGLSLFIISNTVRITILAKQNDIHTMRYLGATGQFIIIPFIAEGVIIGITGAAAAYIATMGGYAYLSSKLISFMDGVVMIYKASSAALPILAEYLFAGVSIGALSSVFPLVKYVKV